MAERETVKKAMPSKRKVPFAVHAPGAREVIITGDFTGWAQDKVRLTKGTAGEWHTILELPPGEHLYLLLIDGEWRDDSEATKRIPTSSG